MKRGVLVKKGDIIIIISTLALSVTVFITMFFFYDKNAQTVTVKKENAIIYEEKLSKDREINLGTNILQIKDSKVKMIYADCKNQICVNHKEISKKGESIICLPNKIVVEIK